tara:strand:- start:1039 stop:1959 length:921 start_codon:yes stop_codon:yes gene_type:complete
MINSFFKINNFLAIFILYLLFCSSSFADTQDVKNVLQEIKSNEDISMGFKKFRDSGDGGKKNNWRITPSAMLKSKPGPEKHVLQIVKKSDGHSVRLGKESVRIEVRNGDSWGWDAENDRERVELIICCAYKTTWNAWSIYFPKDYEVIFPVKTALGQFHNDGDDPPEFMFQNQGDPKGNEGGGYWIEVDETIGGNNKPKKLLDNTEVLGKWKDVVVNAKWTHKKDGFFKIWINGKLSYEHKGMTQIKGNRIEHQLGIYRSYKSRNPGPDPTQIIYYDEIRYAKSCKKLKLEDLGYFCKEIESQNLK